MDGDPRSTGPVLLDAILRHGMDGAAKRLIQDAPFGWGWAGGPPLTERDDFLAGDGLSEATPKDVLDHHIAVYLLDRERSCLEVIPLSASAEPAPPPVFIESGAVSSLPAWYPQPRALGEEPAPVPMSEPARKRVQAFCDPNKIRWPILKGVLRDWCIGMLGDLRGVAWLLAGDPETARPLGRMAETTILVSPGAGRARFAGADGRLREIDVHDAVGASKRIAALAKLPRHSGELGRMGMPLPQHTERALAVLLTAAYAQGLDDPIAHVTWGHGSNQWSFAAASARFPGSCEHVRFPEAWVAPLVSWLLF